MNMPPDRGRGRGNNSRGRGRPRVPYAEIEAYLKANKLQYPSLQEAASASSSTPSIKEVVQSEEIFKSLKTIENIIVLESQDEYINDPWEIMSRYLETTGYPVPEGKNRYIYEAILSESGSVEFHHTYKRKIGKFSPISYSKAIIKMVITIDKWGIYPQQSKILSIKAKNGNPIHYNYWDYIDAWIKAFYYQNRRKKHSWFFKICPNLIGKNEVPNWFYRWWSKFGPQSDYIPIEVHNELEYFIQNHPKIKGTGITEEKSCFFVIQNFGIPWIWRWDVQIGKDNLGLPVLQRTFHYKWWKGINLEQTFSDIRSATQDLKSQIKQKERMPIKNRFSEILTQIRTKNPGSTDNEIFIKTMNFLKDQFLQTVQTIPTVDDDSMTSAKSNKKDNNPFTCLAGEFQDPFEYDGTASTPTLGDFCGTITEMITEQLPSRKGKEKKQE